MKCPNCGSKIKVETRYCPNCRQPLFLHSAPAPAPAEKAPRRAASQRLLVALACVVCAIAVILLIYRLTFWISAYKINRLYTRGELTPTVNTVTLNDGRVGRTVVFYGDDGDQIFIPELNRSLSVCGGVARLSIADADWFTGDVSEVESAKVRLSPMLIEENGTRTRLPDMNFEVAVPDSPMTVVSPAKDNLDVATALYLLELQVVPGSTVLVNGEDVTDTVDRNGLLSQNVNVYPIGDNVYTIIVRTPNHHETRRELTIHRTKYDIDFELSTSVSQTSSNKTVPISGTVEPGADIIVETNHLADSLEINPETGAFSFIAELGDYGNNSVRFRLVKEGRQDAIITVVVNYKPRLAEYSAKAWKMDYAQLRRLYEQWKGRVFLCEGPIIDTVEIDGNTCFVMDVGMGEEQQLVLLQNLSSMSSATYGRNYTAYADVTGHAMYNAEYCPLLAARYIDLTVKN